MILTSIPGYRELFGESTKKYEDFLVNIPSHLVIPLIIAINAELYASLPDIENQTRLRNLFSNNFSKENASFMNRGFLRYKKFVNPDYKGEVFSNRYLIAMCIKELNRNDVSEKDTLSNEDEFNILMAYLTFIQEVNDKDELRYKAFDEFAKDEDFDFRLLWAGLITQYEFTDEPHSAYNVYRLLQFCLYATERFNIFLKEYLTKFGFKTPYEFLSSFIVLAQYVLSEHPENVFRKVNFIHTEDTEKDLHLREMDLSKYRPSARNIALHDVKAFPLFLAREGDYLIIDQHLFIKKIYMGPFFELFKRTQLKKELGANENESFNTYSTLISEDVLEKKCFRQIVSGLQRNKYDVFHVADNTPNSPDAYYRKNKVIFLIEFKGYVFPADLSNKGDFESIKKYLNERFIENPNGVVKGIGQLAKQITLLDNGEFGFDLKFNESIRHSKYTVYPIICHSDYYFGMPGVTDYLNREFQKKLLSLNLKNIKIKQLTVISLSHLFEMVNYGRTFDDLEAFINTYLKRMVARKELRVKSPTINNFLHSYATFDEMFRTHFAHDIRGGNLQKKYINDLIEQSIDILKKPFD